MGMAASQARLLTITARMSDLEFKAQTLQNAKLQLATQSDQVYQNYLAALDATSLTLTYTTSSGQTGYQAATFNNLCSRNRLDSADGTIYALRNKDGNFRNNVKCYFPDIFIPSLGIILEADGINWHQNKEYDLKMKPLIDQIK